MPQATCDCTSHSFVQVQSATVLYEARGPSDVPLIFPFQIILDAVGESIVFPSLAARKTWLEYFESDPSVAVIKVWAMFVACSGCPLRRLASTLNLCDLLLLQDMFWWTVSHFFDSTTTQDTEALFIKRSARSFGVLCLDVPRHFKDLFLQFFYFGLAEVMHRTVVHYVGLHCALLGTLHRRRSR